MPLYNSDVYISIETPNISLAHPSYSNFGQTNDQPLQPAEWHLFLQANSKGGSLLPGSCRLCRHPPTTTAGLFLPATPAPRPARGPAPTRPQAASPIFRAALVQTSASLRPFHSALLRYKGGDTPQLALATPRLRQVAFGI